MPRMWLSCVIYASLLLFSILFCLVVGPLYLFSLLLPEKRRGRLIRRIILAYGRLIVGAAIRPCIRVRYEDRSGGRPGPGLYIFNHRSASDPFLVAVLGEEIIQIVNGWPMRLKFYGYFARLGQYIDATQVDYPTFKTLIQARVAEGVSVAAFPEGTRSGRRGMNAFRSGIFHLARELALPVYPCCIAGNEDLPTRQFRFARRGTILIRQLPPILPGQTAAFPSAYALKKHVHRLIREETEKMDKELDDAVILSQA